MTAASPTPADSKRLATVTARAALRGIALHALQDDRGRSEFIASWHALTRSFPSIEDVEAWLSRIEGSASR